MYLFFVPSIQSGGTESVVLRYCNQLLPDYPVHIFSIVKDVRFSRVSNSFVFESTKSRLYRVLSSRFFRVLFYIYIFFSFLLQLSLHPRFVLCFGELPIFLSAPIAVFCRLIPSFIRFPRFISSFRNDPTTIGPVKKLILGFLLSCFDLSTTNSFSAAAYFNQSPFCFSRVFCLLNPLPSRFLGGGSSLGMNFSRLKMLSVSRLVPQKNISAIINLVSVLKKSLGIPVSLVVVGDGPELFKLRQLSRQLQLDDSVEFRGSLDYFQISSLMSESHGLFHFSLWDGIPNTVLEALSHSLPVFAYDSPNSSLSDLKRFEAPIYFFDSFDSQTLLVHFRSFLKTSLLDSSYSQRSEVFFQNYSSATCLHSFVVNAFSSDSC